MAHSSTKSLSSTLPQSSLGTFFPHILIDQTLPTLKGSEWHLLTVIIRQTIGWHDKATGTRKMRDWLTHGQLRSRTGKGLEAVCAAIDGLVQKGLIEVSDKQGCLLPTPAARRRCRGRLYYSLSPTLLVHFRSGMASSPEGMKSRQAAPIAVSRFGKAEITKEIETNPCSFGKTETGPATLWLESDSEMNAEEIEAASNRFIERYQTMFRDFLSNEPPRITRDTEGQLQSLLQCYSEDEMMRLLEPFFNSRFVYIRQRGYTLGAFVTAFHLLRAI